MSEVPEIDREANQRNKTYKLLKDNLPFFAKSALEIRTKEGLLAPFIFNRAQLYVHQKLEEQKKNTGMVRALILIRFLKSRKTIIFTYSRMSLKQWEHYTMVVKLGLLGSLCASLFSLLRILAVLVMPD